MKIHSFIFATLCMAIVVISCQKDLFISDYQPGNDVIQSNPDHPLNDSVQIIIDKYIAEGIPGIQVSIKNPSGWLYKTGGFAKIETSETFHSGDAAWLFSITKTYTATLVFKLVEAGLMNTDDEIANYLPQNLLSYIADYSKITVRMLLNHTSGIVNVTELPEFVVGQLNNPFNQPSITKRLEMLQGKPLVFEPGTDFMYSNSNYLLLQLMLENVAHKSYAQLLYEQILQPLQLNHTYVNGLSDQQTIDLGFPNYYFDRYANNQIENITKWNNALASASDAYGMLAATPTDVMRFHEALLNGEIISESSLNEMKTWVSGVNSTEPEYGEGFEYWQFNEGSTPQFGHEGDGIGCSTQLFYVPDNQTMVYINTNVGRQIFGPYLFKITDFKRELCRYVANYRPNLPTLYE